MAARLGPAAAWGAMGDGVGLVLNTIRPYVGNIYYLPPGLSINTYGGDAFRNCKQALEQALTGVYDEDDAWQAIDGIAANVPLTQGQAAVDAFHRCIALYRAGMNAAFGERAPAAEQVMAEVLTNKDLHTEALANVPEELFPLAMDNALTTLDRIYRALPLGERVAFTRRLARWLQSIGVPGSVVDELETMEHKS